MAKELYPQFRMDDLDAVADLCDTLERWGVPFHLDDENVVYIETPMEFRVLDREVNPQFLFSGALKF